MKKVKTTSEPTPTCPECDQPVTDEKFCPNCGHPLKTTLRDLFRDANRVTTHHEADIPRGVPETDENDSAEQSQSVLTTGEPHEFPEATTVVATQHTHDLVVVPDEEKKPQGKPRRRRSTLALLGGCSALVVLAIAASGFLISSAKPDTANHSVRNTHSQVTTLPGWNNTSLWSKTGIGNLVVSESGNNLLAASGKSVQILDTKTGSVEAVQQMDGTNIALSSAAISGEPALLAFTSQQLISWTAGSQFDVIALNGRAVLIRGNNVFLRAGDAYSLLTKSGIVPVLPARQGMIPLTATSTSVLWASAEGTVCTCSYNGAVLAEPHLSPPSSGATISSWALPTPGGLTPIASSSVVVVVWGESDGQKIIAFHNTTTGAVITSGIYQSTNAIISQSGTSVTVAGVDFNLDTGATTPEPSSFLPVLYLGTDLWGATNKGQLAVLNGTTLSLLSHTPTVIPAGITGSNDLVTLTNGRLAVYSHLNQKRKDK